MYATGGLFSEKAIARRIDASLECQSNGYPYMIRLANTIMIYMARNKEEQRHCYKIKQRKIKHSFKIINDISEIFTLLQFMDTIVNENHSVSIAGKWIYD